MIRRHSARFIYVKKMHCSEVYTRIHRSAVSRLSAATFVVFIKGYRVGLYVGPIDVGVYIILGLYDYNMI